MTVIRKKILPEYFEAVTSGKKKFELRLNEFDIKEGDTLLLEEWDADKMEYTGRKIERKVTYVRDFKIDKLWWPVKDIMEKGLLVISME